MPRRATVLAEQPWSLKQLLLLPSVSKHPDHQPVWELTLKTGLSVDGQTYVGQTGATGGETVRETQTDDEETGNENHETDGLFVSQMLSLDPVSSSSFVGHHSTQKRREPSVFASSAGLRMLETGETVVSQTGAPV